LAAPIGHYGYQLVGIGIGAKVRTPGEQLAKRMVAAARTTMHATAQPAPGPVGVRRVFLPGRHAPDGDGGAPGLTGSAAPGRTAQSRAAAAARKLVAAALRLPPGPHPVGVQRKLPAVMPDGVTLLADRYFPIGPAGEAGAGQPPVILVRSPYGRSGFVGLAYGHFFAQHGFQAVIQSVRGTFGSGGVFDPLGNERADGLATVAWLEAQPWFGGTFAMYGPSYLGYSQWAIAADAGPGLRAMAAQMAASQFRDAAYLGGAFALESTLTWSDLTTRIERPITGLTAGYASIRRARRAAMSGRPLAELDTLAAGAPV
jgi:uncharacterized protein